MHSLTAPCITWNCCDKLFFNNIIIIITIITNSVTKAASIGETMAGSACRYRPTIRTSWATGLDLNKWSAYWEQRAGALSTHIAHLHPIIVAGCRQEKRIDGERRSGKKGDLEMFTQISCSMSQSCLIQAASKFVLRNTPLNVAEICRVLVKVICGIHKWSISSTCFVFHSSGFF